MDYESHGNIDLHIHTTASDGTYSAGEILDLAQQLGLYAFSITDHDTIAGVKEALRIGIPSSIRFLTGVEISAAPPENFSFSSSFHILGYAIDIDHRELNQSLTLLQKARKNRNPRILQKLLELGIPISMEEITKEADGGQMGRPHIAQVMVKKGIVQSIDDAFDQFLGKGKPAYVDKFRISCQEAVLLIRSAGGIPVLAHPSLLNIPDDILEELVVTLKFMGIEGIEVYYPEHSQERIDHYANLARHYDLLITGGTDFHGELKPDIRMGSGKGNLRIPHLLYEKIAEKKWK
ncbi:MAG: PHP domain-containing protein [Pseudomonadota bacterium]